MRVAELDESGAMNTEEVDTAAVALARQTQRYGVRVRCDGSTAHGIAAARIAARACQALMIRTGALR